MALYVITESPNVDWNNLGFWDSLVKYHYLNESSNGAPTARAEFNRRRDEGLPAVLWEWHNHRPREVERCNLPLPGG